MKLLGNLANLDYQLPNLLISLLLFIHLHQGELLHQLHYLMVSILRFLRLLQYSQSRLLFFYFKLTVILSHFFFGVSKEVLQLTNFFF